MFLSAYTFTGDRDALLAGYHLLVENLGADNLDLNISVVTADGLTVLDGCPSREEFEHFTTSPDFAAAMQSAGLPIPVITPLGEIHVAITKTGVLQDLALA